MTAGTALVTGASSGLGAQFAESLAAAGHDLVITARNEAALSAVAERLRSTHGVRVEVVVADLVEEHSAAVVRDRVESLDLQIDLLVNNAGFATAGRFEQLDPAADHAQVMLNVAAVVDLTHQFLPGMLERQRGAVINVSSIGGFQPAPYLAVYAASKAFVLSFSEALWGECKGRGVAVLTLCPGPVDTAFFDVLGTDKAMIGQRLSVDRVVQQALRDLKAGRSHTIPGYRNRLLTRLPRLLPRRLLIRAAEYATRQVAAEARP